MSGVLGCPRVYIKVPTGSVGLLTVVSKEFFGFQSGVDKLGSHFVLLTSFIFGVDSEVISIARRTVKILP